MAAAYWRDMASGRCRDPLAFLLVALLFVPSLVYGLIQRLRAAAYRSGLLGSRSLPRPVVSVGNITVGGTGKTPAAAHIAAFLLRRGYRVALLSRGYGGSLEGRVAVVSDGERLLLDPAECGDEPFLLARLVPGLIVVIGADRHAAGLAALERFSPDVFLLDDGFQHLRLRRDLDILLLDAVSPYGNGLALPAGLLREPPSAATRADLVIHTRCPVGEGVRHPLSGRPNLAARHRPWPLRPLAGGEPLPLDALCRERCIAFAAIAEPAAFFAGLSAEGIELAEQLIFPDHAPYDSRQLDLIRAALERHGARYAITTAKDAVKLRDAAGLGARLLVADLEFTLDDPSLLEDQLMNLFPAGKVSFSP